MAGAARRFKSSDCWQFTRLGEAASHHGSDSENNRTRTMFVFGFTAGVAFAFGATAYAYRLIQQIPADTTQR